MVDIGTKTDSQRTAHARALMVLPPAVLDLIHEGEIHSKKGPVFQTAMIAGTMAAKKTWDLIPFCHPLGLEKCTMTIDLNADRLVEIHANVAVFYKTGVEMEALTAVSVAALTVYDMCKAVSHEMVISDIRLLGKTGGKQDVGQSL